MLVVSLNRRIGSLNRRIVESCYDSTSKNFIPTRIVRFYNFTNLPAIQIALFFLDRKIVESYIRIAILITMVVILYAP